MKCLDPILCYRAPNGAQYRHFSLANRLFLQVYDDVFPCRTCEQCRKTRARELAIRCVLNASLFKENCFLTLTYDETADGYHNKQDYTHIQKFKKRLRRHVEYHHERKIQIFNVHEYGENGKKHWHLVVFNFDFPDKEKLKKSKGNILYTSTLLSDMWPYGIHSIGDVTEASAMYQAQYTQKDVKNGNTHNDKKADSKHSGIGRDYFLKHYDQIMRLGYIPHAGTNIPVPRYFKKLAHKHFCHFYDQSAFIDYPDRKKLYSKFKKGGANLQIANLFKDFINRINIQTKSAQAEIRTKIDNYLSDGKKPDFILSAENYIYDTLNRQTTKGF